MTGSFSRFALLSLTSLSLAGAMALPANAGFELVPAKTPAPAQQAAPQLEAAPPADVPVGPVANEPLSPLPPMVTEAELKAMQPKAQTQVLEAQVQDAAEAAPAPGGMKTLKILDESAEKPVTAAPVVSAAPAQAPVPAAQPMIPAAAPQTLLVPTPPVNQAQKVELPPLEVPPSVQVEASAPVSAPQVAPAPAVENAAGPQVILPEDAPVTAAEAAQAVSSQPQPLLTPQISAQEGNPDKIILSDDAPASTPLAKEEILAADQPENAAPDAPQNLMPAAEQKSLQQMPAPEAAPVIVPASVAPAIVPATRAVIAGFGKDMPLALALSQVVPSEYAYSFGGGVNPGTRVSWEGDRPWDIVLQDMLAAADMKAYYNQNVIVIRSASTPDKFSEAQLPLDAADKMNAQEPAAGDATTLKADQANEASKQAPVMLENKDAAAVAPIATKRIIVSDPGEEPSLQPMQQSAIEAAPEADAKSAQDQPQVIDFTADAPKPAGEESKAEDSLSAVDAVSPEQSPSKKLPQWLALKGESLKSVLNRWSEKYGFQVIWEAGHDYVLAKDVAVNNDIQTALETLFQSSLNVNAQTAKIDVENQEGADAASASAEVNLKSAEGYESVPVIRFIGQRRDKGSFSAIIIQDPEMKQAPAESKDAENNSDQPLKG